MNGYFTLYACQCKPKYILLAMKSLKNLRTVKKGGSSKEKEMVGVGTLLDPICILQRIVLATCITAKKQRILRGSTSKFYHRLALSLSNQNTSKYPKWEIVLLGVHLQHPWTLSVNFEYFEKCLRKDFFHEIIADFWSCLAWGAPWWMECTVHYSHLNPLTNNPLELLLSIKFPQNSTWVLRKPHRWDIPR